MNRRRFVTMMTGAAAKLALPYSVDFAALADGALPHWFSGATWAVSGGKGVCTPTLGVELLTDPGLEANYTAGLCDSLVVGAGTPTVAESADAHGGTKAQSFIADADGTSIRFPQITPDDASFYKFSVWAKRAAGAAGQVLPTLYQISGAPAAGIFGETVTGAAYAQKAAVIRSKGTGFLFGYPAMQSGSTGYDTVLVDDCSLKKMTESSLMALIPAVSNVTVKAKYTWDKNSWAGVIARADTQAAPSNYLMATYSLHISGVYCFVNLWKCVAGVYTNLISTWSNSPGAGSGDFPTALQNLEIRCSGSTVQLFHNEIQVGADQTVNDVAGTYAGVFQSGGSQLESFLALTTP
jgi:hypothetical protein